MTEFEKHTWSGSALAALDNHISSSEAVLQYGCGAVTRDICEMDEIKYIFSVESDKAVADSIYDSLNHKDKLRLMFVDIGSLDADGMPESSNRFASYHQYMIFPWALADKYDVLPKLVIVDGHFKVASFLYSLICAPQGSTILFNDFFCNEGYEVAREYALLEERHGDMAEFTVHKNFVMSEITAMIAKYSVIAD